jgi:hypothetical protein
MAINSDFNYDDILSLEKAKLIDRAFLNSLGSQELILDYNGIASAAREDSVEWLHANRKSIEDPEFGFKTYEGIWFCIDIKYDENKKTIRQRFKIDSSLEDEATKSTSAGVLAEKSYFWRIVDPTSIDLPVPASIPDGTTYTKTTNDNGDGTYDVVVSKDLSVDFGGGGSSKTWAESGSQVASTNLFVSGSTDANENQEYYLFSGTIGESDAVWKGFTTDTITVKRIVIANITPTWGFDGGSSGSWVASEELISSLWRTGTGLAYDFVPNLVVQVGANGPEYTETTVVSTSSEELSFMPGGTVPLPTIGQEKNISNSPLGNGKFQTTITTRTMNEQRIPAMIGGIVYPSINPQNTYDNNLIVINKNATFEKYQLDMNEMNGIDEANKGRATSVNSVSVNINRFGLYDYTIRSTYDNS